MVKTPLNKSLQHDSFITQSSPSFISFIRTFSTLKPSIVSLFLYQCFDNRNTIQICIAYPFSCFLGLYTSLDACLHRLSQSLDHSIAYRFLHWKRAKVYLPWVTTMLSSLWSHRISQSVLSTLIHKAHRDTPDPPELLNITHIFFGSASPIANRNRQSSVFIHKARSNMADPLNY